MPEILQYILIALAAIGVVALVLKLLKFSFKTIIKIVINAVIGVAAMFLLNLIPGVNMPIEWWTALITGLFGIPGVIVVLIISFFL